jgi:fatty acid amide hydrolase
MTDPSKSSLTGLTASEMAREIAAGNLSSQEVVEAHIRRIEGVNARLNAVVVPLFEQARAAARAADAARERGEPLGPLHGVPVTVKELFDVAGTPTTAGISHRARELATTDSPVVARLRRAGAILLGKTNVSQLAMIYESDNPLYGRTSNPWDLKRSPGGSSGGEAAILAAGGSPLGLGSDAGGSIRQPCHCCGVHGLKPTSGRLPFTGDWLPANFRDEWRQPGPMARSVADLELLLRVLADPGPGSPPLGEAAAVPLAGLRVGMYTDDGYFPASPAIARAVREAAEALRERGAAVAPFRPPDVEEGVRLYYALLYADGMAEAQHSLGGSACDWRIRRLLLLGKAPTPLRPPARWLLALTGQRFAARVLRFLPRRTLSPTALARCLEEQAAYRGRFLAALDAGRFDVLLCPPSGLPALTHGAFNGNIASSYSLLFNLLGLPAGVVAATRVRPGEESERPWRPDGVVRAARAVEAGSTGLPIGVQVVARPWREDVALAVMAALEQHFRQQPDYPNQPPL